LNLNGKNESSVLSDKITSSYTGCHQEMKSAERRGRQQSWERNGKVW